MKQDNSFFRPKSMPEPQLVQDQNRKRAAIYLIISAVVCVGVLNFVPYGFYILYPFYILSTWFHEMGHSITAMIFGSWYNPITIDLNGGGLTYHSTNLALGRLGLAAVAAGGLLGTPIVGGILILFGKTAKRSRIGLYILAVLILGSGLILMMIPSLKSLETLVGFIMVMVMGVVILFIARKGKPGLQQFVIQFLGASAGLFTITRSDYLFVKEIDFGGGVSDVGHIEEYLLLPYWFWGGLIFAISVLIMGFCLYRAFKKPKKDVEPEPFSPTSGV